MGLAEVQAALARLYTEADLRQRFLDFPATVGSELGLSSSETTQIGTISADQVALFASSLIAKRRQEIRKLLPLTCRTLGEDFPVSFSRHAQVPLSGGVHKHRRDALAFVASLRSADGVSLSVRELARYEGAWLEAHAHRTWLMFRLFQYPVGQASQLAGDGLPLADLPRCLTLGLWLRSRHEGWHHYLVPR